MHTTENPSARLRADLSAFIGTENWHRHGINRQMLLTDGVVYYADQAGAWWFLDIVATEVMRFHQLKPFLVIDFDVEDGKADIRVSDGNDLTCARCASTTSPTPSTSGSSWATT